MYKGQLFFLVTQRAQIGAVVCECVEGYHGTLLLLIVYSVSDSLLCVPQGSLISSSPRDQSFSNSASFTLGNVPRRSPYFFMSAP